MKNKNLVIAIISVVAVILITIGVTYAYWLVTKTQEGENVISSACLDIEMTENSAYGDITLQDQYPLADDDGMELVPFEFMVTNNCNANIDYQINLETLGSETNTIIPSAIKIALNNDVSLLSEKGETSPTLSEAYTARKLITGTLGYSETASQETPISKVYDLRLWIDKNAPISEQNKTFRSKITVTVGQGIVNSKETPIAEGTLAYDILSKHGGASAITEIENFTNAPASGVYKTEDDLGISYYFRGNNNYYIKLGANVDNTVQGVHMYLGDESNIFYGPFNSMTECEESRSEKIAEGAPEELACKDYNGLHYASYLWRILRINGDNSIRLIFAGVTDTIDYTDFLPLFNYDYNDIDDAKYVGYTYEVNGIETDSDAKIELKNFYSTYLSEYEDYFADSIFCNDRRVSRTDGEKIYYAAYDRINNNQPSLLCPNKSDRYMMNNELGNGLLSEPIGLITADEMYFTNYSDNPYYTGIRTMTPAMYSDYEFGESPMAAYTYSLDSGILPVPTYVSAMVNLPVINLKADVSFTGNGSYETPYEIVMK